jgi:tetraacyldisaccharide 4'-kinase
MSAGGLGNAARRLWDGELGGTGRVVNAALAPAELLYRAVTAARNGAYARGLLRSARAQLPVISIGNIAVGGSGKTPFASWLVRALVERGERPALVHGGYAEDEPELHRTWTPDVPVIVDRDRARAAATAKAGGATVVVLDDAFQHRRLHRNLDIVLVTAERWTRDAHLLPRGPWREPAGALQRADVIVCVRRTASAEDSAAAATDIADAAQRPVVRALLRAVRWLRDGREVESPPPTGAVLVAGIAEPALFAANARAAGADIATELIFDDHHGYTTEDAQAIRTAALERAVVTTAKDWVKLRAWLDPASTYVLAQDVIVEAGMQQLETALERVLQ